MANTVITIGREFGSGGREIGLLLSERLNIPFYDKYLITKSAESGGMHEDFMARNEEKCASIGAPVFGRSLIAVYYQPSFSDTIFIEQSKVIKALAEKGPCVIVGRCADYVLRGLPNVFRVYIYAGLPYKILRKREVAPEKAGCSDEEMKKYIREVEKGRTKYYERYTGLKKGVAENYDLCLRTDNIGSRGAVEAIITCLKNFN